MAGLAHVVAAGAVFADGRKNGKGTSTRQCGPGGLPLHTACAHAIPRRASGEPRVERPSILCHVSRTPYR